MRLEEREMSDLIRRTALLEFAHNHVNGTVDCNDIARFPAVDAEPVRHGLWGECHITGYDGLHAVYTRQCSECGHESRFITRYCPVCGARMDAEAKE